MKITKLLLSLLLFVVFQTSCKHKAVDVNDIRKVCYKNEIAPILNSRCSMCHGDSISEEEINLSTYDGVMKLVSKGKPLKSRIYKSIKKDMPPLPNTPLSEEQRSLIYAWILQGADTTNCK
ncbi:MAG: c-type cytochrome domain-containing protein [Bacteroidales bacterium]|jgi:uncharacterized membrane protein